MYSEVVLAAWLAISTVPAPTTEAPPPPSTPSLTAEASPALTEEQRAATLVDRLAKVCAAHSEVERAFVLVQQAPDGSPAYMFIPIFDRDVSDEALDEADAAYRELYPTNGHLPMTLLARNTWKKTLGGVPPIYIRQGT